MTANPLPSPIIRSWLSALHSFSSFSLTHSLSSFRSLLQTLYTPEPSDLQSISTFFSPSPSQIRCSRLITIRSHLWFNIGALHGSLGEYHLATLSFRQAISLDASDPLPHFALGIAEYELRHFVRAGRSWAKCLQIMSEKNMDECQYAMLDLVGPMGDMGKGSNEKAGDDSCAGLDVVDGMRFRLWTLSRTRVDWNARMAIFEKNWKAARVERPGDGKWGINGMPMGVVFLPDECVPVPKSAPHNKAEAEQPGHVPNSTLTPSENDKSPPDYLYSVMDKAFLGLLSPSSQVKRKPLPPLPPPTPIAAPTSTSAALSPPQSQPFLPGSSSPTLNIGTNADTDITILLPTVYQPSSSSSGSAARSPYSLDILTAYESLTSSPISSVSSSSSSEDNNSMTGADRSNSDRVHRRDFAVSSPCNSAPSPNQGFRARFEPGPRHTTRFDIEQRQPVLRRRRLIPTTSAFASEETGGRRLWIGRRRASPEPEPRPTSSMYSRDDYSDPRIWLESSSNRISIPQPEQRPPSSIYSPYSSIHSPNTIPNRNDHSRSSAEIERSSVSPRAIYSGITDSSGIGIPSHDCPSGTPSSTIYSHDTSPTNSPSPTRAHPSSVPIPSNSISSSTTSTPARRRAYLRTISSSSSSSSSPQDPHPPSPTAHSSRGSRP
ncbi:hypothetical protein MMC20_003861 [Loxospora ochrophaea]|nr:hypothetical protein [Loxospora ochrophaea]